MSIGAPIGVPAVDTIASKARRNCVQASHADTPVVGQPPATVVQAAVCTVKAPMRSAFFISIERAANTAHCRAWDPLCV